MNVRFVESPPPIGGPQDPRSVWMSRLRPLVERPGEWAEVYSGTPSACHQAAQALRLRQYWIPPGAWEFTIRSYKRARESTAVLYARYLADDGPLFRTRSEAYNHSEDALWDEQGRRICPMCERNPLIKEPIGSYPHACDSCSWAMAVPGIPHGRVASYRHAGCRCPDCRRANRENERAKRLQDAASDLVPTSTQSEAAAEGNDAGSGAV